MFERLTTEVNSTLDLAYHEINSLGHREVATAQLLLGLIRLGTGVAAQVLRDAGVNLENARIEVEKIQGRGKGYRGEIAYNQHTRQVFDFSGEEADRLKDLIRITGTKQP
jgi:ATP-dependent Clp protease ATP-binding subunit ClpA